MFKFIVGIVFIGMVINQILTTKIMEKNVRKDTDERGVTVVKQLAKNFETELIEYEKAIKLMGESNAFSKELSKDKDALEEGLSLFKSYTESNPQVLSIYVAQEDKSMFAEPWWDKPSDYDPTDRDWYLNAVENPDKIIWTEPYIDADHNVPVITAAKCIMGNNEVKSVIAVDLSLEESLSNIKDFNSGYNGYNFLVSDKGVALYHPTLI